jgi:LAS superfamily LD-carboxypeptidase LdcB
MVNSTAALASLITGRSESHLVPLGERFAQVKVHYAVQEPLLKLQKKAFRAGFELEVVSSFRSFESQLRIWNQKATGTRPVLSSEGEPLRRADFSDKEWVYAILHWSALPGASRHHWGTDFDVIDRLSVPPRYTVQLTPEEVNPGGMFAALHDWLDRHMAEEGFFRPYQKDLGGVQPERWHLSHSPTSKPLFDAHQEVTVREALETSTIELKETVLAELPEIFDRYFRRISHG